MHDVPDTFAEHFSNKVKTIVDACIVNDSVYNGTKKLQSQTQNFMTAGNVTNAIKSLQKVETANTTVVKNLLRINN